MNKYYLDFEEPLKEYDKSISELSNGSSISSIDNQNIKKLKKERHKLIETISNNLTRWQRVQLARHPERPYTKDIIEYMITDFIELHGDRHYSDDHAVIGGIGFLGKRKIVIIGQQKGRNTKENLFRNFGMMRPDGYRKALRIMKLGEKFKLPIITLIDTPGAYPGLGAEERGQGEAIARNLIKMSSLKVPIISLVIGEGASGGALGIGLCDRFLMMENTWYSVISPEGCASILYRDPSKAEVAAESLKVAPQDLVDVNICDKIILEPNGGAHRDKEASLDLLRETINEELEILEKIDPESFLNNRIQKYDKLGYFES